MFSSPPIFKSWLCSVSTNQKTKLASWGLRIYQLTGQTRKYLTSIYRCTQTCLQKKWNVAILFWFSIFLSPFQSLKDSVMKLWVYLWRFFWISHFAATGPKSTPWRSHKPIFSSSLWARLHYTLEKINIFNKQSSIFCLHDSHQKLIWGLSTETRSNDILFAVESELTYFMAGEITEATNETEKKCFSILFYTKSFPFFITLIEGVVNDISPGQLLNMVCFTCKHTDKMHASVWSISAFSLPLPLVPFHILKQVKLF